MFKDLGRAACDARRARGSRDSCTTRVREIEVYRDLLAAPASARPPTTAPRRPARGRYWLFIENVAGPVLCQVGRVRRLGGGRPLARAPARALAPAAAGRLALAAALRPRPVPHVDLARARLRGAPRDAVERREARGGAGPRGALRAGGRAAGRASRPRSSTASSIPPTCSCSDAGEACASPRSTGRSRRSAPACWTSRRSRSASGRRRERDALAHAYREAPQPQARSPPTSTRARLLPPAPGRPGLGWDPAWQPPGRASPRLAGRGAAGSRTSCGSRVEGMAASETQTGRRMLDLLRFAVPWDAAVAILGSGGRGNRPAAGGRRCSRTARATRISPTRR